MRLCPAVALTLAATTGFADPVSDTPLPGRDANAVEFRIETRGDIIGGLSGIEVSDDGTLLTALSDRGFLVYAGLIRQDGRLVAVDILGKQQLAPPPGVLPSQMDTEGLAWRAGGMLISVEQVHQVWQLDEALRARALPPVPGADQLPANQGFEALAVDAEGTPYTLAEAHLPGGEGRPLWRHDGTTWQIARHLPQHADYRPVGADFGPDGKLYLLERALGLGLRNRVLRVDPLDPGDPPQLIWQSAARPLLNFEGLAVWQPPGGPITLTLVSDNNFLPLIRSAILEIPLDTKGESR